jgi:cation transport ATPase-like protein
MEPASPRALEGPPEKRHLLDGSVLRRVFGVLGPMQALFEMLAFAAVLLASGWRWGQAAAPEALAAAAGTAFAAVVLGQVGNALACRSTTIWWAGWAGGQIDF